jgi:hypothetical protein
MGSVVSSIFGGGGGGASAPPAPPLSTYDPFSAVGGTGAAVGSESGRQYAANQLYNLIQNPSMALSQPGYQQTLAQGTAAQQAAGAASGTLQSGGQAAALQGYGQNIFNQYYNQLYNQLGTLSGATTQTPGGAASQQFNAQLGSAQLQNQIQQQNAQTGIFSTLLAGSALSKSGIFGGGGPAGYDGWQTSGSMDLFGSSSSGLGAGGSAEYLAEIGLL